MVCLGNEQRSFCHFWHYIQVLHFKLFVDHDGYSIYSKGFLSSVVDTMVSSGYNSWITMLYTWNLHNILNQLYLNSKILGNYLMEFTLEVFRLTCDLSPLSSFLFLPFRMRMSILFLSHHFILEAHNLSGFTLGKEFGLRMTYTSNLTHTLFRW